MNTLQPDLVVSEGEALRRLVACYRLILEAAEPEPPPAYTWPGMYDGRDASPDLADDGGQVVEPWPGMFSEEVSMNGHNK